MPKFVIGCRVVSFRVLTNNCQMSLSAVVPGSNGCRLSVVGCLLLIVGVGCRSLFRLSVPSSADMYTIHIPNICNNFAVGEEETNDETIGRLHPVNPHHKTEGEFIIYLYKGFLFTM